MNTPDLFDEPTRAPNAILPRVTSQDGQATPEMLAALTAMAAAWKTDPAAEYARWISTQGYGAANGARYRERSIRQFSSMFGRFVRWLGGQRGIGLDTFAQADIENFFATLGKRGDTIAISTARRYLWILSAVVEHLNLIGIRHDPMDSMGTSRINPAHELSMREDYRFQEAAAPAFLTRGQDQQYIRWVKEQPVAGWVDVRDKAFRLVFIASGITLEEARRLKSTDAIESDGQVIELRIAPRGHGHYARTVPVLDWARHEISEWCHLRNGIHSPSDALFLARSTDFALDEPGASAISPTESFTCIQQAIQAVVSTTSRHGPMTLRHTFTAMQLLRGIPRNIVKEWLGLQTEDMVAAVARQIPALGELARAQQQANP